LLASDFLAYGSFSQYSEGHWLHLRGNCQRVLDELQEISANNQVLVDDRGASDSSSK
jgi:hypothetical protein